MAPTITPTHRLALQQCQLQNGDRPTATLGLREVGIVASMRLADCVAKTILVKPNQPPISFRLFSFQFEDLPDKLNLPKDIPLGNHFTHGSGKYDLAVSTFLFVINCTPSKLSRRFC
jgi:hypothetical protein